MTLGQRLEFMTPNYLWLLLANLRVACFLFIKYYFCVDRSSWSEIIYDNRVGWLLKALGRILVNSIKIALARGSIASGVRAARIWFPISTLYSLCNIG